MTSFGWKRKIGGRVSQSASCAFEDDAASDVINDKNVSPKKRTVQENPIAKSQRLEDEGTTLAEAEKYWQALKKWDAAIRLTPKNEKLHEMKAQVLLSLHELYPALQAASEAVSLKPQWWASHQTLGRVYLGIGEVQMAIKSFSEALHLNPHEKELWTDDLMWAQSLLKQKEEQEKLERQQEISITDTKMTIIELGESGEMMDTDDIVIDNTLRRETEAVVSRPITSTSRIPNHTNQSQQPIKDLPKGYVLMRDSDENRFDGVD